MLEKYHSCRYRVYNLCSERTYDESRFKTGTVVSFPMDDHQVPPLSILFSFIECAATAASCSAVSHMCFPGSSGGTGGRHYRTATRCS
jgi:hypothetical protein